MSGRLVLETTEDKVCKVCGKPATWQHIALEDEADGYFCQEHAIAQKGADYVDSWIWVQKVAKIGPRYPLEDIGE